MNPEEPLISTILERTGMRKELVAPKVQTILERLPASGRADAVQHLLQLDPRGAEWMGFMEDFLVHETYFFRHEGQLDFLSKKVLPELLAERIKSGTHEFKAWCAACSSGEEAYSIGLLLKDAIAASKQSAQLNWHTSIVGTDLSSSVLSIAKRGEYTLTSGLNSFRDVPDFARHHFAGVLHGTQKTWLADEHLRRTTSFQQRNILTDPAPVTGADLVLCRNVLIYMDEARKERAIKTLVSALRPGGVLVLGPADMLKEPESLSLSLLAGERAMFWKKNNPNPRPF